MLYLEGECGCIISNMPIIDNKFKTIERKCLSILREHKTKQFNVADIPDLEEESKYRIY
uniref:Uncharacterized protein n=1 Tax=Meloidogyne enterolobii TaxID=390850 RepID=A0A6V7X931_MELEN|nr:unnamed protein product [Meloidogyne enterolobii]